MFFFLPWPDFFVVYKGFGLSNPGSASQLSLRVCAVYDSLTPRAGCPEAGVGRGPATPHPGAPRAGAGPAGGLQPVRPLLGEEQPRGASAPGGAQTGHQELSGESGTTKMYFSILQNYFLTPGRPGGPGVPARRAGGQDPHHQPGRPRLQDQARQPQTPP